MRLWTGHLVYAVLIRSALYIFFILIWNKNGINAIIALGKLINYPIALVIDSKLQIVWKADSLSAHSLGPKLMVKNTGKIIRETFGFYISTQALNLWGLPEFSFLLVLPNCMILGSLYHYSTSKKGIKVLTSVNYFWFHI